jgi:Transposase
MMSDTDDLHQRLSETNRLIARGHTVEEALRRTDVSRAVFATWLKENGGNVAVPLDILQHLQSENSRLRRSLAKLSMEQRQRSRPQPDYFSRPLRMV